MSTDPIAPQLDEIRNDLHALLVSAIEDADNFNTWLDMLLTETYGRVLCVNLYIDLTNRCLDTSLVANIINKMMFGVSDPRWAFYRYVEEHQGEALFNHLGGALSLENDRFIRILSMADMIDYYLRKPLNLPLTYEAEQEVLERFFNLPTNKRERLGVVSEVQRGRMLNVWVTSKGALDSSIAGLSSDDLADTLRDRLGFSNLNRGRLVCIIYPPNFDRARSFVPTTLDAHFGSMYYVSTGKNDWGLTCGLNSLSDGMRERVHESFNGLSDDFEMELLGEITRSANPDLNHLINEALGRTR